MAEPKRASYLPIFKNPVKTPEEHLIERHSSHSSSDTEEDEPYSDKAAFRRHTETTRSELFYDLFFVANLTVFTAKHEVNDVQTFKQYVGFFSLLWLTWYQVSLYDVRYGADSVIDRIAKAVQFGVMMGFAILGPEFNVGTSGTGIISDSSWTYLRALSIILMVSRFVLVFQYGYIMYCSRHLKSAILPFAGIMATYSITAFVYLGLAFTFTEKSTKTYVAWYVFGLTEAVIVTGISTFWRVISFKGTHLVQRMSLLTLIFLGEGIIGAAKRTQKALISPVFRLSPVVLGNAVCIVLILYFLYICYFDWIEEEHFGTIREQIWAFLHFPLHISLVVAVEGIAQFMAWTSAVDAGNGVAEITGAFPVDDEAATAKAIVKLTKMASKISKYDFSTLSYSEFETWQFTNQTLYWAIDQTGNYTWSAYNRTVLADGVEEILRNMITNIAGFKAPEVNHTLRADKGDDAIDDLNKAIEGQYMVFVLTFLYTFIAMGMVVMLIALIAAISKKSKRGAHWTRLSLNFAVGAAISLIAAVGRTVNLKSEQDTDYDKFISSGWMLPTIALLLFLVVVLNSVKLPTHETLREAVGRFTRPKRPTISHPF